MITREEYELLKEYRRLGFKWIARDKNWKLFMYQEMPRRYRTIWNFGGGAINIQEEYFTFIKLEDEKPTKIDDLINDYESHQVIVGESVKVTVPQFVADWIEDRKNIYTLKGLFESSEMPESVESWIACDNEKCELLALAWIYGYEVEKEKLYTVRLANGSILIKDPEFNTFQLCKAPKEQIEGYEYKLIQSEIESVDPRFMQFAEEVSS